MTSLSIDSLQEGDILLMMGDGPLSELIAWASDGVYSHAAIVVDKGELIEASLGGVRRYPLARRIAEFEHFHCIDAFRTDDDHGRPFAAGDRRLVGQRAQTMLGAPYPVDQLALLGVIMAVRGKWPAHPLARRLVRLALDRASPTDSPAMVCSEVVYRAWAECAVEPQGRMAPRIVEGERGTAPFPAIDWKRLFDEIGPLLGLATPGLAGPAARSANAAHATAEALLGDGGEIPDEALEQARQRVLARLDGQGPLRSAGADAGFTARPNPRLVSPQDLANSPSVTLIGRLMERAG
ncbi:hypothetical protein [Luteimonas terricola]|uniref:Uncharacterized protein n=1 Tax=Luteimonas terricola TaxID=645597 RepID=A0ABQ2ECY1_9GAMM|nr:hypothetical protein [Luteimonas terricola]GGK02582.1 hypothetical protein GCM10011394_09510 [Luteimonas terricola]